jgi:soluble lytic murein transglycosylase-like protein
MISLVFILPFFCGIQNACAQNDLLSVEKTEHLFHRIIVRAADRHNIDPALIKAIIMAESRYNPGAVSKRGAKGLMQLMPKTAKSLGVKDIFDPEHNINGGVKYFKQLLDEFGGKVRLALAAYNAGSRKVKKYRGIPPYRATRRYIKNVFTYYQYYKDKMDEEAGRA